MTVDYIITHRNKSSTVAPSAGWRVKEVEASTMIEAVKKALSPAQIARHDFVVYDVNDAIHGDQFHNDGTFDGLLEDEGLV